MQYYVSSLTVSKFGNVHNYVIFPKEVFFPIVHNFHHNYIYM